MGLKESNQTKVMTVVFVVSFWAQSYLYKKQNTSCMKNKVRDSKSDMIKIASGSLAAQLKEVSAAAAIILNRYGTY